MTTAAGALEESLRMGNATGGEMNLYAMGNTTNYWVRTNFNASYFNAGTSCRLQVGTNDIITCSSTTATMVQGITISDGKNITFNTTTGTKIGATTSDKLAFWNTTPNVQPTTAITAAAFVANTSLIANDTATFGGYTMGQVVAALKRIGLLA
jgi:hypothetical protein